jgi:LAGLIDADG endonuclease
LSDFLIFKQCFEIIKQGEHLTENGLLKIISLKTNLNLGLPHNLIEAFPKMVSITKPDYIFKGIPDPFWISGFTSGDGSFNLKIGSSATTSIGVRVQLRFAIGLHIRELDVIKGLAAYFNLLYPLTSKSIEVSNVKYKNITTTSKVVNFQVTKFSDIVNIIIPFFDKYPIQGQKALDFEDFKKVVEIMKINDHLTVKGFEKILKIKEGMNLNRLW